MPEAWPSMRSTAKWVLPVLVGPRTATRREGEAPAERSLMTWKVGDSRPGNKVHWRGKRALTTGSAAVEQARNESGPNQRPPPIQSLFPTRYGVLLRWRSQES